MIRQDMRYDTRTQKHRLRRGEVTLTELGEHLDALPDEAEECVETNVRYTSPYEDRLHKDHD